MPGWLCADWWYPGHAVYVYCVQDWVMIPEQFPSGLVRPTSLSCAFLKASKCTPNNVLDGAQAGMYKKLDVPFLYYMPYWCMDNNTARTAQWEFLTQEDCGWACEYTFVRGAQSEAFHTQLFEK